MAANETAKYVKTQTLQPSHHPDFTKDPIHLVGSDIDFGNRPFILLYECISRPGAMVMEHHKHDYDQYLNFIGGDPTDMLDLHGELELTLSTDGVHLEKHTITRATSVYIPAGLYHCPLVYNRVDRPFIFLEIQFSAKYARTEIPINQ